ncbi:MAG: phage portal protein [Epsilonproteobacteria bacterium]|nr:MAG: phage portal protein [Campylobacterota bacterium]
MSNMSIHQAITNQRGFYEGGKYTEANKNFWNANSEFEETASLDRNVMRARARHLAANNAIMNNIDGAILDNVVGTGIRLQSRTNIKNLDDEIESRFEIWATSPALCDSTGRLNFYDMQRVILQTRMVDGEIYIYKRITKEGLKLQLIEADALDDGGIDQGIEINPDGSVKGYRFKVKDKNGYYSSKTITIASRHIINYHSTTRATQYRGVSEYAQAIVDIKNFSAFQTATVQSALAKANIAYTVEGDMSINNNGLDKTSRIKEVNGIAVHYLKIGEKINKLAGDSATADYKDFSESTIRLIATARRISFELAFRDYSRVNFASSRASLAQDNKRFDVDQKSLVNYILNDIYYTWMLTEIMRGTIKIPIAKFLSDHIPYTRKRWVFPPKTFVDPLKEVNAIEKEIALNMTTETDVCAMRGNDFRDVIARKVEEQEIKDELGYEEEMVVEDKGDVKEVRELLMRVHDLLSELEER